MHDGLWYGITVQLMQTYLCVVPPNVNVNPHNSNHDIRLKHCLDIALGTSTGTGAKLSTYKMIDRATILKIRIISKSLKCCAKMLRYIPLQNAALFEEQGCICSNTISSCDRNLVDKRLLCPMQSSHQWISVQKKATQTITCTRSPLP